MNSMLTSPVAEPAKLTRHTAPGPSRAVMLEQDLGYWNDVEKSSTDGLLQRRRPVSRFVIDTDDAPEVATARTMVACSGTVTSTTWGSWTALQTRARPSLMPCSEALPVVGITMSAGTSGSR